MKFLSEIFGFESSSNRDTEKDDENPAEEMFAMFDDITKIIRRKLSWCRFQARQIQRRRSQSHLYDRRQMYDSASRGRNTIDSVRNILSTDNGIPKRCSDGAILENITNLMARRTRTDQSDRVATKLAALRWQNTVDNNIGKTATDDLLNNGIPKSRSDSAISENHKTNHNPRARRTDVSDRVTTKLAARRKELGAMTSSQRVAYFRQKYNLKAY